MLGSYQVFFLKVLIISCLIFEISCLARVENWSQHRRPNNTVPNNQWHSSANAATARSPYQQPHGANQWNPYNQTTGNNNNYNNNNNNWQHNTTHNQHPGQTNTQQPAGWGGGGAAAQRPQTINPWLRNNQTTHNNNPQNPYIWNAARPNTTHIATTPASHNSGWGAASSAGQNNWGNTPQQYPGVVRPTSPPTSGWGAARPNATQYHAPSSTNTNNNINWGQSTGAGQNNWNIPQQYPGGVNPKNHTTDGWHANSGSGSGNDNQPGAGGYSRQPQPQQPQNPTFGSGWHSSSTSTGQASPGLAPLTPIGGSGAGTGNLSPWNNNDNTQTGGASSTAGAAPLAPIGGGWNTGGLNNPWNSGNTQPNTGSSSGAPLAPLGGGSGASTWNGANGGQAGLSYGQQQPGQANGAGGNNNPYANLFN